MLVPFSAFGITVERSVLTRSAVVCSAGPVVAIALKYAVVPALSIWTGVTAATPEVDETSFSSVVSRESFVPLAGEPSEAATISGPFTPAPKLCEIRSYARRAVVDVESAATSF